MNGLPFLIGIAGGSGCGKTYLAHQVAEAAGVDRVSVLNMDHYFRSEDEDADPSRINFDHPKHLDLRLFIRHVRALKAGKTVRVPHYDFGTRLQRARARKVEPRPVVIVEGLFLLNDPIAELFDLTCFLHVEPDQRLLGRILRDAVERHASVEEIVERYQRFVRPSYEVFIRPTMQRADVLVDFTYRRAFFAQLLIHIIRDYVDGSLEMTDLIQTIRGESYRRAFELEEGWHPLLPDIFRLSQAYPESPPTLRSQLAT
jgi:uridine kinase